MTNKITRSVTLSAPISKVWQAVSDHKQFGTWFRVNIKEPFEEGKPATGNITYPGYEHVVWQVMIKKIEPETYFSFTWHPYAVDSSVDYSSEEPTLVEFRLEPQGEGTCLTVTESGFDKIPEHRRSEAFRMNDGGWAEQMRNIQAHVDS